MAGKQLKRASFANHPLKLSRKTEADCFVAFDNRS